MLSSRTAARACITRVLISAVGLLVMAAAYPLAIVALFFAGSVLGMFMPNRIDHHGWQLAMLAICIAAKPSNSWSAGP